MMYADYFMPANQLFSGMIRQKMKGMTEKKKNCAFKKVVHAGDALKCADADVPEEGWASEFTGEGKIQDSLRFAARKIDTLVAAGKMDDARGSGIIKQLKKIEVSEASDDDKDVQISQLIGSFIRIR